VEETMNTYAINMIVKQQQDEIRRKAAIQNRLDKADREYREWAAGRLSLAVMSLMIPVSLLGIFILA
jgi:hypothetical protein